MSLMTRSMPLVAARPRGRARRALLAIAEMLARVAMHQPDRAAAAHREAQVAQRDRDGLRLAALLPPLR